MIAIIHYNGIYEDEFIVEADTFEELKQTALAETGKRGWEDYVCDFTDAQYEDNVYCHHGEREEE